jgi:hypothetical protein
MNIFFALLAAFGVATAGFPAEKSSFNVLDFGAKGDGAK